MQQKKNFQDKLRAVRSSVVGFQGNSNPNSWLEEATDHINIARDSKDPVGKMLNLDNVRHFQHPVLGQFRSLNSIWFFLKAKERTDAIRNLTGHELKEFIRVRCGGTIQGIIPNFRAVIMHSAYLRIKNAAEMRNAVIKSTLPFDCYRLLNSGIRQRYEHTEWFCGAYEEIRNALRENREPNLDHLRTDGGHGDAGLYDGVIEMIRPKVDEVALEQARRKLAEERKLANKKPVKPRPVSQENRQVVEAPAAPYVPMGSLPIVMDIDGAAIAASVQAVLAEEPSSVVVQEEPVSSEHSFAVEEKPAVVELQSAAVATEPETCGNGCEGCACSGEVEAESAQVQESDDEGPVEVTALESDAVEDSAAPDDLAVEETSLKTAMAEAMAAAVAENQSLVPERYRAEPELDTAIAFGVANTTVQQV